MKATPEPMVSGRYFLPKAALLWVKWRLAEWVMSSKWICWGDCAGFWVWVAEVVARARMRVSEQTRVPATAGRRGLLKPGERRVITLCLSGLLGHRQDCLCYLNRVESLVGAFR